MNASTGGHNLEALVDELARVLSEPDEARALVQRVGLALGSMPSWSTAQAFWSRVVDELEGGRLAGGALRLAREVAMQWPDDAVLAKLVAQLSNARDLMAPDTDPTDAELALVMNAAWDLAMERQTRSDAWVEARLEEAARFAREQHDPVSRRGGKGS